MIILVIVSVVFGLVAGQEGEVSFSAGLTHDQTIQHAGNVIFNKVFSNKGSGYDNNTGVFTCPLAGYYVFQFHMLAQNYRSAWLELYKNADYIESVYGHNTDDYASGGNSVILKLAQGDTISIKGVDNSFGSDTNLYGRQDEIYCVLSGYLVHAD